MTITIEEVRVAYRKINNLEQEKALLKAQLKEIDASIESLYQALSDNLVPKDDGQMKLA